MAKGVGGDVFGDAGKAGILLNNPFDRTWTEPAKIARGVRYILIGRVIEEKSGKSVTSGGKVFFKMIGSGLINKDRAVFFTFTANHKLAAGEVNGVTIQVTKFRNTKSTGE